ncbi:hypothetical protein ACLOJK_005875 [Asimina triloba]
MVGRCWTWEAGWGRSSPTSCCGRRWWPSVGAVAGEAGERASTVDEADGRWLGRRLDLASGGRWLGAAGGGGRSAVEDADAGVVRVEETMIGGAVGWMGLRSDLQKRDRDQCVVPVILGGLDSPCMLSPEYPSAAGLRRVMEHRIRCSGECLIIQGLPPKGLTEQLGSLIIHGVVMVLEQPLHTVYNLYLLSMMVFGFCIAFCNVNFFAVPDLETVKFRVLKRREEYEIREVELCILGQPYFIAETTMPGKSGFDFYGASRSFNVLASYLFGKNTSNESMEMTTPVYTRKTQSDGAKMETTTPVVTKRSGDQGNWQMSFVMPSKFGGKLPLPNDSSVKIKEVPKKIVAVSAFSGFVTDEEVKRRELKLRDYLRRDSQFQVKENASVEVAQYPAATDKHQDCIVEPGSLVAME